MSLSDTQDLSWAALSDEQKRDAVFDQLVLGLDLAGAADALAVIYGSVGLQHVRLIVRRFSLSTNPAVVAARAGAGRAAKSKAPRARAREAGAGKVVKLRPVPRLTPSVEPAAPVKHPNIFQVKAQQCRFPLWGSGVVAPTEKRFCGNQTEQGETYCSACAERVFRNDEQGEPEGGA
ncbi:hypothetical protein TRICHSKD4_2400 [Roseibium sp. TrichSKD4]|uniref:GcrA family cell cycle regulator n=1 Tax=Roseibium sp. TrichSKD4 TaxID=744980 RepID=UPI0001E56B08|nr:GcrA family cell cycle regulator [Roseibium sp. TrichSKD4]EFO32598.1 hypothetical protein TRICHSKD4_2400 [Roseibium sp. TrichSKD4]